MEHQALLAGLVRLHILHHAVAGEVYGQWMIEELARHGYKLSAGTLYPMLHAMERRGYLQSSRQRIGRTFRRVYRATPRPSRRPRQSRRVVRRDRPGRNDVAIALIGVALLERWRLPPILIVLFCVASALVAAAA
jgi:DNA-binding PadR family transcriptional regulator